MTLKKGLTARRESKAVDFKSSFDPASKGDWCELVKDLVSMANSGGGLILIGVDNHGKGVGGVNMSDILAIDPAVITDKVAKYTGEQFDAFEVSEATRDGTTIAVLSVRGASSPLVFESPGNYQVDEKRQQTAFSAGTLYVRHGAKSAPATTSDLAKIIERHVARVRKNWMDGVRKVVNAPADATISVSPPVVTQTTAPGATPIRVTKDPQAPEFRIVGPDKDYPFRQKELIEEVNRRLAGKCRINQFDMQAVRQLYAVDENGTYFYKSKFGSPQYSQSFADWLVAQYQHDPQFFAKSRNEYSIRKLL